jgi:hypothetical protein
MRLWLGHDKDPKLLDDDLRWWLKVKNFGMCRRSVQAENISGIGWLLYSTKEVDCAALQSAIEKKLGNKFKAGCRYKMISLGRRGRFLRRTKSRLCILSAIPLANSM